MNELQPEQYHVVRPLFAPLHHCVPIYAVIEDHNLGRVFANSEERPTLALIWAAGGYAYVGGSPSPANADALHALLYDVLLPEAVAQGERGFILYPADPKWDQVTGRLLPGRKVHAIFRRHFAAPPAAAPELSGEPPEGITLHAVGSEHLARYEDLSREILSFWPTTAAFLEEGTGVCALHGDELAGVCFTAMVGAGRGELSIYTGAPYRQKGLGYRMGARTIAGIYDRGLIPSWECFWNNTPSDALARKLGFDQSADVPVYYWEEKPGS